MTAYQNIVRSHLVAIFEKGLLYTDDVVLLIENDVFRKWVIELSLDHGYVPVFSKKHSIANRDSKRKYVIVSFIKKIIPC